MLLTELFDGFSGMSNLVPPPPPPPPPELLVPLAWDCDVSNFISLVVVVFMLFAISVTVTL